MLRVFVLLAGVCLSLFITSNSALGDLVYVDAVDSNNHPSAPGGLNTFNVDNSPWVTTTGDGSPQWRFRNTGPATESFGTTAWQGKVSEGDGPAYTKVTGLTPGASYGGLRIYFVGHALNQGTWLIDYSLDGVSWSSPLGYASSGVVRLATSTSDPLGTPSPGGDVGDTRCYFPIPGTLTANGSGEIQLYFRPSGSDRTIYDGIAYDDGVTAPPSSASAPQPADTATFFTGNLPTSLSWSNPPTAGTLTCNVYFGDENSYDSGNTNHFGLPLIQSGVAGNSIPVPTLVAGNTYYWIVDCVDTVDGLLPGPLWSFEIQPLSATTGVLISEFMAANGTTSTNSLGGADDWIEIYNNTASTVNLAGWHLTDDANNLIKWTFPSVLMSPGTYLVVWASNGNTVTNGEIHTSFRLSAGGEYLALVGPDGVTIEHEYAPQFPEQADDISYGVDLLFNGADVTLAPSQTACQVLVPASGIGTNWQARIYDDSSWQPGATGVGYETSGSSYDENINTDVQAAMHNQRTSVYLRIPFQVDDPALYSGMELQMLFEDGFVAYINGVEVARSNAPATPNYNSTATASRSQAQALLVVAFPVLQNLNSLLVTGTNVLAIHGLNQSSGAATFLMQPTLEATLATGVVVEQKRYYSVPTPGAPNSDAFLGFVADTKFSADRGFYSSPFSVAITCNTPGAAIRYTLDGSTPSEVHGTLYTGLIPVNTTTTLRAVAYKTGWKSSDVDTQTYLFLDHVLNQPAAPAGWPSTWQGNVTYDAGINWSDYQMDPDVIGAPNNLANSVRAALTNIPTLSLVTDLDNLFNPDTGIYANPRQEGVAWERPVSAEMIYPDGRKGFQANCGLRIQGAGSRGPASTPKHSLRLLFKGIYGPTRLKHKMFPTTHLDSFNSIHLRAPYNNAWTKLQSDQRARSQANRDQFARDLQLAMGQETDHGTLCHLYINGLYWGIYHPGERPDASWASDHMGGQEEDWDVLNHGDVVDGNKTAWDAMWAIASSSSALSSLTAYNNFRQYCDVENFADYCMIMHYMGNNDWDNVNWYAVRKREAGAGYKFVAWDTEGGLSPKDSTAAVDVNTIGSFNANGPSTLFIRAKASAEFKLLVADRLHKYFFNGGIMTPTGATNIWRQRSDVIDSVIAAESARWGDFRKDVLPSSPNVIYTPNGHYYPQQSFLFGTYFPQRSAVVFNQYVAQGFYPTVAAPEFIGQHGGTFSNLLNITISGPGTIYYTLDGSDPREYGTGNVLGTQYTGAIPLTYSTRVKARCKSGSIWSALLEADFIHLAPSPLRVSEVMYAPRLPTGAETATVSNASAFAFVEIHNTGSQTAGLVGVTLQDGLTFDFSKSSLLSLAAGEYAVVVENPAAFALRYPAVPTSKIAGEFFGDLATGGDSVKLMVEGVGQVVSFDYSDGRGWPVAADQAGHSLIPLVTMDQSSGQLDYGGNWKASVNVDGSPAAPEPNPIALLALNEVIAHTDFSDPGYPGYDSNDKIELINHGPLSISLNGYYLSDDVSSLKKWAIPAGTNVSAGGIIVFDEITGFHAPITSGFGLNKAGEQLFLSYASGGDPASVVDAVEFRGQEKGRSLGRYPDATGHWRECLPTPGLANVPAGQQPVISEIMYHPTSAIPFIDNTADEFVEIFNPTAGDVNLWSMDGGTNIGSWRLDGEVDYVFPGSTVLSAGSHVLIVSFDPANATSRAAFLATYGLSEPQNLFGPFSGKLSNDGGRLALEKPLAPDPDQPVQAISWVIVDEVFYADDTPWSTTADGLGESLHRVAVGGSGVDPGSWASAAPSPSAGGTVIIEDPYLSITMVGGQVTLGFTLPPDYSYTIETRTNFATDVWAPLTTVTNPATEHVLGAPGTSSAFFRLRRDP